MISPRSTSDIVHSLTNQITYVKKLVTVVRVNANAIVNFSTIVKNIVAQSQVWFQKFARGVMWLNYTLQDQSELLTAVRKLELALLRIIKKVSDLKLFRTVSVARQVTYEPNKSNYLTEYIKKFNRESARVI